MADFLKRRVEQLMKAESSVIAARQHSLHNLDGAQALCLGARRHEHGEAYQNLNGAARARLSTGHELPSVARSYAHVVLLNISEQCALGDGTTMVGK